MIATITEGLCGTNGCDTGETVIGVTLILAIAAVLVAWLQ